MGLIPPRAWVYQHLAPIFDGVVDTLPGAPGDAMPPDLASRVTVLRAALSSTRPEATLVDHARLFVNAEEGVAAPPYASWYLDGRLFGPSCDWVARAYAAQGLEPDADAGEPLDYIAAELEFLYFLARHEAAARQTGDGEALAAVIAGEASFVTGHFARWVPAFIARIRGAAPGPVFAAAADLLDAVLREDVRRLSGRRSKTTANGQAAETGCFSEVAGVPSK